MKSKSDTVIHLHGTFGSNFINNITFTKHEEGNTRLAGLGVTSNHFLSVFYQSK